MTALRLWQVIACAAFSCATLATAFGAQGPPGAAAPDPGATATLAPATGLPESLPTPAGAIATPVAGAPLLVRGQVLSLGSGFLVFTTGEALRLATSLRLPQHAPLGIFVRATVDPVSRAVVALAFQPQRSLPEEIDAAHLPRAYVVASAESLASIAPATGSGPLARKVTMTIDVRVPENTPLTDEVYVATDRSSFGSAEIHMQRVDQHRWTVQVTLESGTTLRYVFTRGFNTTLERDRLGGIVTPRAVTVSDGLTTDDTVARWSDIQ